MADDPNPALRAQLIKDRDGMARAIKGLPDIARTTVSDDLKTDFNQQLHLRERRRDLIQLALDGLDRVVDALSVLEADGWPAPVSQFVLDARLWAELKDQQADLDAAIQVFRQEAAIAVNTADVTFTTQNTPDRPGP